MYCFCVLSILMQSLFVLPAYGIPGDTRRIRFGEEATENQFPYFGHLEIGDLLGDYVHYYYCGSTVIAVRWLLSVAHCFTNIRLYSVSVYLGSNKYKQGEKYAIDTKVKLHPGYKREYKNKVPFMYNDIAVLKTVNEIPFSNKIKPLKIIHYEVGPLVIVHHVGFGSDKEPTTEENRNYITPELRYTKRLVTRKDACQNILKELIGFLDTHMCSLPIDNRGGTPCYGDSGGPVVFKADDEENRRLVGIISQSNKCDTNPDAFVNVFFYKDFIQNITGSLNIIGPLGI